MFLKVKEWKNYNFIKYTEILYFNIFGFFLKYKITILKF